MRSSLTYEDIQLIFRILLKNEPEIIYDDLDDAVEQFSSARYVTRILLSYKTGFNICKKGIDYAILFARPKHREGFRYITYYFQLRNNGSLLLFFPSWLRYPNYLNFDKSSGLQWKIRFFFHRAILALKLPQLISDGRFTIYYRDTLLFDRLMESFSCNGYSVYFGSPETGHKTVVELSRDKTTLYFAKKVWNDRAIHGLKNEVDNLALLKKFNLMYFTIPRCESADPTLAIVENIRPTGSFLHTRLTYTHLRALKELYACTSHVKSIADSLFWNEINEKLSAIDPYHITKQWIDIYNALTELKSSVNVKTTIPVSLAHCDFTPLNMYLSTGRVHLFDWESARNEIPLFYDAFHFIFIAESKIRKSPHNLIKEEITHLKNQKVIKELIQLLGIDFQLHYKLYLLHSISQTLFAWQHKIMQSADFSELLMQNWLKALNDSREVKDTISHRQMFIMHMVSEPFLREYAILNLNADSIYRINESFEPEILIRKKNFGRVIEFIKKYAGYRKLIIEKKYNKNITELFFTDGSYLRITFIFNFFTKGFNFMDSEWVLKNAERTAENVMVASPADMFEYIFIPRMIRKKNIHPVWAAYFENQSLDVKADVAYQMIKKYDLNINSLNPLYTFNGDIYIQAVKQLIASGKKKFDLQFKIFHFFYKIHKKYPCNGFLITFSGIDRSGKSTVLKMLATLISNKYHRKVMVLKYSSFFNAATLSKTTEGNREKLPVSDKRKKSQFRSYMRFSKYFLHFIFVQWKVWFKYRLKGYIVLYDRYYFDLIADPGLFDFEINNRLARFSYHFVFKPRLNIFLYSPPSEIIKRNTLLDEETIEMVTDNYISYFHDLSLRKTNSRYLSVENIYLDKVIDQVERELGKVI